jgi:hypothetical protein
MTTSDRMFGEHGQHGEHSQGEHDRTPGELDPPRGDDGLPRGGEDHARPGGDPADDFEDDAVTSELVRDADPTGRLAALPAVRNAVHHKNRRHRRDRPRGTTIALKRVSLAELALGAAMYPPVEFERPRTRGDCGAEARPCPWVACKHHLYLDINPETGSIKINFPDREPWELEHTCALDIAEAGGKTLDEIGEITNLTRERIRQVEVRGLGKLRTRRQLR